MGCSLVVLLTAMIAYPPHSLTGASGPEATPNTVSQDDQRKIGDIRRDVRAFAARSRKAKSETEIADAVVDMCRLHDEIVNDDRFQSSRDLQGLRAQLWQRLKTIKKDISQKIAREERLRKRQLRARGLDDVPSEKGSDSNAEPSPGDFDFLAGKMSQQMAFANQMTGGPSQLFAYAGGRWAGPPDYGPDLVELIEDTINPDHWEKNGGPGRIRYYKPLMILVVTGSMHVHDDLGKMLRTLRSISR